MLTTEYFDALSSINAQEWMFVVVSCLIFMTSVYFFAKKRHLNLPPGPTGLPFIGYYPFLNRTRPHEQFNKLAKKYGDVFSLNVGGTLLVVCNSWEAVKDAYGKTATANRPPELFSTLRYGLGIGSENGHAWTLQRRFCIRVLKDMGLGTSKWENFLREEVRDTIHRLENESSKPLDVTPFFAETFTSNILTLLFGYRLQTGHNTITYISRALDAIMNEFATIRLANFWPSFCRNLGKLGLYGARGAILHDFVKFTEKWVKQRLLDHKQDGEESFIKSYSGEVQNHKTKETSTVFSENSLYANSQAFLLGGSETSRTTLIWLLIAMAENPQHQRKVQEELDAAMSKDDVISWSERSKFPVTYATLMESMRIYLTVPVNALRMTNEDVQIMGYDVPKGSYITSNIWAIHHDPKYWDEPDKFNPSRFLTDNGTKINFKPDSYMPFSYGKRGCPGEQVGLMEVLCYFSSLLRNFTVTPESGVKVQHGTCMGLTCQATGVKLKFIPRD